MQWNKVDMHSLNGLPEEGLVVETKIDNKWSGIRNQTRLKRMHNLWFIPSGEMYVYYCPTHWRFIQDSSNGGNV